MSRKDEEEDEEEEEDGCRGGRREEKEEEGEVGEKVKGEGRKKATKRLGID